MVGIDDLTRIRLEEPERICRALANRPRAAPPQPGEKLMVIAADHPARGSLGVTDAPTAMADRRELLRRCIAALNRPGVDGFLGTADMVEDLTLLGALDQKFVYGSMNRGGLAGSRFEADDRFTGYTTETIQRAGLDGGKMLLRLDLEDPATVATMETSARAVDALAAAGLTAMVEPFISRRDHGRLVNDLSTEAVVKSAAIASGLAGSSARTWLKLPLVPEMEAVAAASTMPMLILGGEVDDDAEAKAHGWTQALRLPGIEGLVIGRSLLYPRDDDVEKAVDRVVGLI